MRDGTLFVGVPMKSAFVSFLCASFFFSVLLLLLLRVRVASRALGKRRSRFSNSLVTHPVESAQNAEEDARRRTNERANFDGFTRFFPFFLSLYSLSSTTL